MQQVIRRASFPLAFSGMGALSATASTAGEIQQCEVGVAAATGEIAAIAAGTSTLIPLIGPALAGIALAVNAIMNSGCGRRASKLRNGRIQAEVCSCRIFWLTSASPAPRSTQAQAVALSGFDNIWQGWRIPVRSRAQGRRGRAYISDRQAGHDWKQTADQPPISPGKLQVGECWNWHNGYRDPIAMDATVDASVAAGAASGSSTGSTSTSSLTSMECLTAAGAGLSAVVRDGDN